MSTQHLNAATAELIQLVGQFYAGWLANNAKAPEDWPLEMDQPEWWEHFIVWVQEEAGKSPA